MEEGIVTCPDFLNPTSSSYDLCPRFLGLLACQQLWPLSFPDMLNSLLTCLVLFYPSVTVAYDAQLPQ